MKSTHPQKVQDPGVWLAADIGATRSWVHRLTPEFQDEIEASVRRAVALGKSYTDVGLAEFPLPKTRSMLREVFNDLEEGAGFSVVGDYPVDRFTYEENLIGYAGVSAHLGTLVDQSYAGAMKADVKDLGLAYGKDVRGYQSSAMLRFHTDGAVLTGLLCLQSAVEGGLSVLASSGALSNRILAERPDLHEILVAGFHHHRRGEHAPGDNPVSPAPIPVFAFHDGLLHCTYDRNQSLWSAEEGIVFTPMQIEAMDYLDALMARPECQLQMEMQQGDIQYLNNFAVMHARTEYRDSDTQKRHLVRYWIDVPNGKRKGLTTRDLYVRDGSLDVQQSWRQ